jgi:hypothetical protein
LTHATHRYERIFFAWYAKLLDGKHLHGDSCERGMVCGLRTCHQYRLAVRGYQHTRRFEMDGEVGEIPHMCWTKNSVIVTIGEQQIQPSWLHALLNREPSAFEFLSRE